MADRRADVDLWINLLAEHETTKVAHLVDALAERAGAPRKDASRIEDTKRDALEEIDLEERDSKGPDPWARAPIRRPAAIWTKPPPS